VTGPAISSIADTSGWRAGGPGARRIFEVFHAGMAASLRSLG
jgi:hypothetical protein